MNPGPFGRGVHGGCELCQVGAGCGDVVVLCVAFTVFYF